MSVDELQLELAARMPWLRAEGESWWVVTGSYGAGDTFKACIAQVVPEFVTSCEVGDWPLFEVRAWGDSTKFVPANRITHAQRLLLTLADDPLTAYYADEQDFLDAALAKRDEETNR